MKKWTKRLPGFGAAMGCLAMVATGGICHATRGHSGPAVTPSGDRLLPARSAESDPSAGGTLRVLTLNVAHGRAEGLHQALMRRATIQRHLDAIARVLDRQRPDVVALQEADGPSIQSGRFDHVDYLADRAGYGDYCRGEHVDGLRLSYGTALLARRPLADCRSVAFAPSPPTFTKGFVVATTAWPGRPGRSIDVVSVHLDFARGSVRRRQVQTMVAELSSRGRPMIVMGDFNCGWTTADGPLATLAEGLDLTAYEPAASDMPTFSATGKRLDWILLSPELEFVAYETLSDAVSDHCGVAAVVRLVGDE